MQKHCNHMLNQVMQMQYNENLMLVPDNQKKSISLSYKL